MQKRKFTWTTHKVIRETKDAVTIEFDLIGAGFRYLPGQFINVSVIVNEERLTRSYSLSSSPDLDLHPAITVKRVKDGLLSNYLVDRAEQILEWEIEGPYGSFIPLESSYQSKHVVLLSGGSGIAPLLSIAKSLLSKSAVQLTLIVANHYWCDVIFTDAIEALALQYKERLTVIHARSQYDGTKPVFTGTLIEGRLSKLVVKKLLKQATGRKLSTTHFFICGPHRLMKMYHEVLESLKVPETGIFMERFTADDEPAAQLKNLPEITHEVLVHFYEQTHLIEIPPGTTLLSAALKEGISFGHSCKSGTCGSCVALLTSGKVNMVKNHALTEKESSTGHDFAVPELCCE